MPSEKTSLTLLWNPHRRTEKGEKDSSVSADLWRCPGETVSCGATQFDPSRPPRFLCLGCFRPLATTGAIPRTGFQAPRCTVRCSVRDGAVDEHTAGRFGLERALLATLAYVLAVFLAGSEGVYTAATYTVFLSPLLLSVSSRVLQHMVYLSATFMRYFPCFCEDHIPFPPPRHARLLHHPAGIDNNPIKRKQHNFGVGLGTQLSTRPRMFLFIVDSFVCTRYSVTNMNNPPSVSKRTTSPWRRLRGRSCGLQANIVEEFCSDEAARSSGQVSVSRRTSLRSTCP